MPWLNSKTKKKKKKKLRIAIEADLTSWLGSNVMGFLAFLPKARRFLGTENIQVRKCGDVAD